MCVLLTKRCVLKHFVNAIDCLGALNYRLVVEDVVPVSLYETPSISVLSQYEHPVPYDTRIWERGRGAWLCGIPWGSGSCFLVVK